MDAWMNSVTMVIKPGQKLNTESQATAPSTPSLSPAGILLQPLLWTSSGKRLAKAFYVI